MIMLNVGSKYVTIELSKTQEEYLRNTLGRQILIFAIAFTATKDIILSLILTSVFYVLTMHLFNEKEQLRKYNDVYQIVNEYYSIRYEYYNKRKKYLIDKLGKELIILSNKAKYIQETLNDKIDLRKKSRDQIDKMLETMKFDKHIQDNNYNYLIQNHFHQYYLYL